MIGRNGGRGIAGLACLSALLAPPAIAASQSRTIGFVITSWRPALYETPEAKECPGGFSPGEGAQAKAQEGSAERLRKFSWPENRGPNGESARFSPTTVRDPLPFSELQTPYGLGFNLDGTNDGRATAKSLKHAKFTSDGERIDNQLSRLIGCSKDWRSTGLSAEYASMEIRDSAATRTLIEVSGVDDERNDPSVEVTIYKGADSELVPGPGGTFIPFRSQRVDTRYTRYVNRMRGKIVDGVLTTEPIAMATLPAVLIRVNGERRMRDFRLRLKLGETGAEGMAGGYEVLRNWWNLFSKSGSSTSVSFSSTYQAMLRYADGYPDPKTGKATAMSAAYKLTAVRAEIIHPARDRGARIARADDTDGN